MEQLYWDPTVPRQQYHSSRFSFIQKQLSFLDPSSLHKSNQVQSVRTFSGLISSGLLIQIKTIKPLMKIVSFPVLSAMHSGTEENFQRSLTSTDSSSFFLHYFCSLLNPCPWTEAFLCVTLATLFLDCHLSLHFDSFRQDSFSEHFPL